MTNEEWELKCRNLERELAEQLQAAWMYERNDAWKESKSTLRDEFATAALPQVLALTAKLHEGTPGANPDGAELTAAVGRQCYVYADAMLEARKAKP